MGVSPSLNEKMYIKTTPNQKLGIDIPKIATVIDRLSTIEYCLVAETTPAGIAIPIAKPIAATASMIVLGKRANISSQTRS
jgi:hypothetical protein